MGLARKPVDRKHLTEQARQHLDMKITPRSGETAEVRRRDLLQALFENHGLINVSHQAEYPRHTPNTNYVWHVELKGKKIHLVKRLNFMQIGDV